MDFRSCIHSTQNEIRLMRSQIEILSADSSQGRMFELEKVSLILRKSQDILRASRFFQQIKSAERYVKRLEFQLCRIEELQEQYEVQMRLREGTAKSGG